MTLLATTSAPATRQSPERDRTDIHDGTKKINVNDEKLRLKPIVIFVV